MIISDKNNINLAQRKRFWFFLAIGVLVAVSSLFLFSVYNYLNKPINKDIYYCDAEFTRGNKFFSNGFYFGGGNEQSSSFSKSGKYSCKLKKSKDYQYAFGMELPEFKPGETYKASVWRYRVKGGDDGFLAVAAEGKGQFKDFTRQIIKSTGSWELLELEFQIPYYSEVNSIKIYAYTAGNYEVYFDDFRVQKTQEASNLATSKWTPNTIKLKLKYEALNKIKEKRNQALIDGILESAEDDWVKTKILENTSSTEISAKLRLKGDWLDHLGGNKWSFRVKTKNGETYNRLRYFSLHTPAARSHLHEWVLHKLFEQEDVLTTFYDFLYVELNNKSLGIYAIEEHFDKVLLERQKRREGPIIKFSENGFWSGMKRHNVLLNRIDNTLDHSIKKPEAAPVLPFHENKTISTPLLEAQFEQASTLLDQYKNGTISPSEIFDLPKLAKYFAICDALSAYHGITWHNQRFYYNPINSKLEPIGFDGYGGHIFRKNYFTGMGALNSRKVDKEAIENLLFLDVEFTKHYSHFLYKFTSRSFLNAFFASIQEELNTRAAFLKTEFKEYKFDQEKMIDNAQRMHSMILPFNDHSLKAFIQKKDDSFKTLKVTSYHGLPIAIVGSGPSASNMNDTLHNPMILESFYKRHIQNRRQRDSAALSITYTEVEQAYRAQEPNKYYTAKISKDNQYLFFKPLGIDSIFSTKIHNWPVKNEPTTRQSIFEDINLVSNSVYTVSDRMVFFKKGIHKISEPIIIPSNYRVVFEAGVQLDFIKRAMFISNSPVFFNGTSETPIIIKSSDKSAQGFTIMQADQRSKIHYTIFDQFDTLKENGWSLTGAVTFFESDVDIQYAVFKNNVCEDGLNIIRSDFLFQNSLISNTFSDGLDADFCKGKIENATFINTGNDGMDFSGSVIYINHTDVKNAGDKGISVGEDSDASIGQISIENSNIAVGVKDLSTLMIEKINLKSCNQGFIAFQKKPEFGGATIIVKNYVSEEIKRLHNIREGSTLQLIDKMIIGEKLGR